MYATVNGARVPLEDVTLDDFGWDNAEARGRESLVLHLTPDDLVQIGQPVWNYARECEADEPGFFQEELRQDIPVPASDRIFVDAPSLLATYLQDPFWAREVVLAILDLITVDPSSNPSYWIEDFRQAQVEPGGLAVEFGAAGTRLRT